MRTKTLSALCGAALIGASLCGCATAPKKSAHKSAPRAVSTPAEAMALKHYNLGIDAYSNDRYAEAIDHWRITLKEDPQNTNAADYIERAQNMLKAVKAAPLAKPTPAPGSPVAKTKTAKP